jgi:hypothetical protein
MLMTPSFDHISRDGGNSPSSSPPPSSPFPSAPDPAQIEAHLTWWHGGALIDPQSPDKQIVLCAIRHPKKDSMQFEAFADIPGAVRWAVAAAAHSNVYYHIALHGYCPRGKGSIETALYLPGLVTDLDGQSPFREDNAGKAPSVEALYQLIHDFEQHYPFRLNLVESGYGLYPQIRFKEPLFLGEPETRKEANELLARFTEAFRALARPRGWHATADRTTLASVLRLPGTWNRKGSSPRPVRLVDRAGGPL